MPLAPIVATHLTTPETRAVSLFIGGRDFTMALDIGSTTFTDSGTSARSTANMRLRTSLAAAPEIYDQAFVQLIDHTANVVLFSGFVRSRHPTTDIAPMLDIIADDIGGLLDDIFIEHVEPPLTFMPGILAQLWGAFGNGYLSSDISFIESSGAPLPSMPLTAMTLREAIETVIAQSVTPGNPIYYFVDTLGKLHVFTSASDPAPYDVIVGTPAGGQIAPEDLDIDWDSNTYYNRVYVQGGTPEGTGFVTDAAAIAAANGLVRTGTLQAPECSTETMRNSLGSMYLGRVSSAMMRGTFTTQTPYDGWRSNQIVEVTDSAKGLAAEPFRVARVTTRLYRLAASIGRHYTVEFGATRVTGT